MFCTYCGGTLGEQSLFCPRCGMKKNPSVQTGNENPIFTLTPNEKRQYELTVLPDRMRISGKFMYLKDKEFYRSKVPQDEALRSNFIGMGYLSQRSYRKTIWFVLSGTLIELLKIVIDKLSELADCANEILNWFGESVEVPEAFDYAMNTLVAISILLGIVLFASKKKVIEISFTDKRICVPQKSMTQSEFQMLNQSIKQ